MTEEFSDEEINAYVDDELGREERVRLLAAAEYSDALRKRICETSYLKEVVKQAYPVPEIEGRPAAVVSSGWRNMAIAASLALVALMVFSFSPFQRESLSLKTQELLVQSAGRDVKRVVFHISTDDAQVSAELMDQVELVLSQYRKNNESIRVHVVANNRGLRSLQLGRSTIANRIEQLDRQYDNVVFAACGNTIDRFHKQKGEKITVLPSAVIIKSGVSYVTRRQSEGWIYIKV